jgi:NADH-quinone oxidoreductase subunit F
MKDQAYRMHVLVCGGTSCVSHNAFEIKASLESELKQHRLENEIQVVTTGCNGFCEHCPLLIVKPENIFYTHLKLKDVPFLVEEHFLKGRPVRRLMYTPPAEPGPIAKLSEIGFFKKQMLLALRNRGLIDPENIDDYLARDGYRALTKALVDMTPETIIDEMKKAGLRGRGGAGFPTGLKWEYVRNAEGSPKYIICNGDEGDPGAYMDRSIVEGDPHSVLEGMLIGARAIGSDQGYVYVRNEYPLAHARITKAIDQAREYGLLGEDILGSGFNFQVKVVRGAGAFICGEETALIASVEGHVGEPRPRPPYPAQSGLWGKPTNINNVETWANVPVIIDRGSAWFSSIGTKMSKGTKVFSVVGKVKDTGLVEVPMGTTLGEIVFDICSGIANDRKFKAIQIGGPSGGCIPVEHLNLPVDYEHLTGAGAMMGSGGMVVMDENTCMVDIAHFFLTFTKDESCGKCSPCREGIPQMLNILTRIKQGTAEVEDLALLEDLAAVVKDTALCGLGKTAPNPVLTTLRYFKNEYLEHIKYKRCRAGVCTHLISAPCHHACPIETEASSYVALIAQGKFKEALEVNRNANPLPSVCSRICHHPCESRCKLGETGQPISLRRLKRFVADLEPPTNGRPRPKRAANKLEKVAIVGSGPAGLMAAWDLGRRGYQVTVFESESVPGGMLAWGIPEFRLPKDVLNAEIEAIQDFGVTFQTKTRIGQDLSLDDLFTQGHRAVFIAVGAAKNIKLGIPGEDLAGVIDPIEFLKTYNLTKKAAVGKKVAVVGGGNTAIDAARTAWRLGADVTVLYRRERRDMPAIPEEIEEALEEGIRIEYLTVPVEAVAENGKLSRLRCARMALSRFDDSGRRKPVPIEDSEFEMEADTLIPAVGQKPDLAFLDGNPKLKRTKAGALAVDPETLATNVPGIFAGGDVVSGPATVLEAMRAGQIAAESIHRYIRGEILEREYRPTVSKIHVPPLDLTGQEDLNPTRPAGRRLPVPERKGNFREVELSLDKETAIAEARRCLRCDLESARLRGE